MNRRNFSLLAVTGFLGLAAAKPSSASSHQERLEQKQILTGVFHTIGSGVSLGGQGNVMDGRFENAIDSQTRIGNGSLTFNENGFGIAKILNNKIVQEQDTSAPYHQRITSEFEFSFRITKTDEILLWIKSGSWKGQVIDGLNNGKTYDVELIGDYINNKPHLVGDLSVDGKNIQLTTVEELLTRIKFSDGSERDEITSCSINGFKR